jgi:hypothetical protein
MHDELDKLIDGALAEYSSAQPLAGIEQRVLDRVRLAQAARRRWRWSLLVAVPALAAGLLVLFAPKPQPQPVPVAVVAPPPAPVVQPTIRAAVPSRGATKRRPATVRRPELPKRGVFPTISPLTGEERLLVQLAQSNPRFFEARPADSLEIKPIEIAPIQIDGAQ